MFFSVDFVVYIYTILCGLKVLKITIIVFNGQFEANLKFLHRRRYLRNDKIIHFRKILQFMVASACTGRNDCHILQ